MSNTDNNESIGCKQCPHDVGDSYRRDCCFPDCVGGWEQAFKSVCGQRDTLQQQVEELQSIIDNDPAYADLMQQGLSLAAKHNEKLEQRAERLEEALVFASKFKALDNYYKGDRRLGDVVRQALQNTRCGPK